MQRSITLIASLLAISNAHAAGTLTFSQPYSETISTQEAASTFDLELTFNGVTSTSTGPHRAFVHIEAADGTFLASAETPIPAQSLTNWSGTITVKVPNKPNRGTLTQYPTPATYRVLAGIYLDAPGQPRVPLTKANDGYTSNDGTTNRVQVGLLNTTSKPIARLKAGAANLKCDGSTDYSSQLFGLLNSVASNTLVRLPDGVCRYSIMASYDPNTVNQKRHEYPYLRPGTVLSLPSDRTSPNNVALNFLPLAVNFPYEGQTNLSTRKRNVAIVGGGQPTTRLLASKNSALAPTALPNTKMVSSALFAMGIDELDIRDMTLETDASIKGTERMGAATSNALVVIDSTGVDIRRITVDSSANAGIMFDKVTVENASGKRTLNKIYDSKVRNTLADGIHLTGASKQVRVAGNIVENTGDDGISSIGYAPLPPNQFQYPGNNESIFIAGNEITGTKSSGITLEGTSTAIVGQSTVSASISKESGSNIINGTTSAGIRIESSTSWKTGSVSNVKVYGNKITGSAIFENCVLLNGVYIDNLGRTINPTTQPPVPYNSTTCYRNNHAQINISSSFDNLLSIDVQRNTLIRGEATKSAGSSVAIGTYTVKDVSPLPTISSFALKDNCAMTTPGSAQFTLAYRPDATFANPPTVSNNVISATASCAQ